MSDIIKDDGGPAFPCDWVDTQPHTGIQVVREQFPGMSLRDWFAGQALQGIIAAKANSTTKIENGNQRIYFDVQLGVDVAYGYADAMIAAKDKKNTP